MDNIDINDYIILFLTMVYVCLMLVNIFFIDIPKELMLLIANPIIGFVLGLTLGRIMFRNM
jgi:hypothetical protein